MKERPILFSAPMIRALLDGRKTQTRRIVKPQLVDHDFGPGGVSPAFMPPETINGYLAVGLSTMLKDNFAYLKNPPYGIIGDQLWVRETWYCDHYLVQRGPFLELEGAKEMLVYRADNPRPYEAEQPIWRPSIFMPRWASRIQLEITGVRVERLRDILHDDALAEGCLGQGWKVSDNRHPVIYPVIEYKELWESLNGAGSWAENPWVWVIEFRRIK